MMQDIRVAVLCPSFCYAEGTLRVDVGARFNSRDTGYLPDGRKFEIVVQPRYLRGRRSKFQQYVILWPDFRVSVREQDELHEMEMMAHYFSWEKVSFNG